MKPDLNELITVRDYLPEDKAFVLSTWLRGFYGGERWIQEIEKKDFMSAYNSLINTAIQNKRFKFKIACLKDDNNVILGYVVMSHDETVVHWSFTKAAWRRIGIAKKLIPANIVAVTHLTTLGRSLLRSKLPNVKFNPFLI